MPLIITSGYGSLGFVAPSIFSIDPHPTYIDLTFTTSMADPVGAAADPTSWVLSGPIAVDVTAVAKIAATVIRLSITEPKGGETYSLNLPDSGLTSLSGTPYNGSDPVSFVAVADPPVALLAQVLDSTHVRVIFSEPVLTAEAVDASNYSISPLLTVSAVTQEDARNYVLTTSPQTPTVLYTITVVNVRDRSENPV